jgi:glycosyltransferase involved in cell wall biosynthesis
MQSPGRNDSPPADLPGSENKFIVGTAARFAGVKRIDLLIKAFEIFSMGKEDLLLLLIGDGPLRGEFENMVREKGLLSKTIFTGYRHDVSRYQQRLHVCVSPSEGESFGLNAIEMLALGKPVVVLNDGGGLVEIVSGISGDDVVFSVEGIVNRLNHYYTHRLDTLIQRRIAYSHKFDIRKTETQFFEIYKNV